MAEDGLKWPKEQHFEQNRPKCRYLLSTRESLQRLFESYHKALADGLEPLRALASLLKGMALLHPLPDTCLGCLVLSKGAILPFS